MLADIFDQPHEREVSDEEYSTLAKEFRGGRRSWFGDIGDAKKAVMGSFEARGYSTREFEYYDRVVSRNASMHLHSTATGVAVSGRGSATIGDDHFPTYGFLADVDEDEMLATLLTAAACLGTIAHVVYEEWGINSEEVSAANEGAQTAVLRLSPSKRRSLGRNDPCWCGSGKKLKACHGV